MPRLSALAFSMGTYGLTRGGLITFQTQIFTGSSDFVVADDLTEIDEYLIVGGGGGGGTNWGGGAGAGGYLMGTAHPVTPGSTITLTVGAGGSVSAASPYGQKGSNSTFDSLHGEGGGHGANNVSSGTEAGGDGGSGGGTRSSTPTDVGEGNTGPGQFGNDGGRSTYPTNAAGGGGGAGSVGGEGSNPGGGGAGGAGLDTSPLYPTTVAGGGGGGVQGGGIGGPAGSGGGGAGSPGGSSAGSAGTENTGGGGGGGGSNTQGGQGGSGLVVLKYKFVSGQVLQLGASSEVTIPKGVSTIDYFILAGGGSGGSAGGNGGSGGGGGAGGARLASGFPVNEGDTLTITVGGGGEAADMPLAYGKYGNNSTIEFSPSSVILGTVGGGGGGAGGNYGPDGSGLNGGCGGGSAEYHSNGTWRGQSHLRKWPAAAPPYNGFSGVPNGNSPTFDAPSGETLSYPAQGFDGGQGGVISPPDYGPGIQPNPFDSPTVPMGSPGSRSGGGGGIGSAGVNVGGSPGGGHGGRGYFVDLTGTSKGYGGGGGGGAGGPSDQEGRGGAGPGPGVYASGGDSGPNYPGGGTTTGYFGGGNGIGGDFTVPPHASASGPIPDGVENSGGGGGGSRFYQGHPNNQGWAGKGGSGIVIIKLNS